jgi:hypothetical protein
MLHLPWKLHRVSSILVFLEFHVPGEGARDHEALHHVTIPELVLDVVCMVGTVLLEESLEVVCRWPHVALDATSDGHDALLVGTVRLLAVVIIIMAGGGSSPLRTPLLPLLDVLGILHGALDGATLLLLGTISLPHRMGRGSTASLLLAY